GFNIFFCPTQRGLVLFSGLETGLPAGHSTLRYFAVTDQHYSDGRGLLVAIHKTGKLDPFPDELCAGLVTVARLPALADCGYLRAAGFRLFLFDDSKLDSRAVQRSAGRTAGSAPYRCDAT